MLFICYFLIFHMMNRVVNYFVFSIFRYSLNRVRKLIGKTKTLKTQTLCAFWPRNTLYEIHDIIDDEGMMKVNGKRNVRWEEWF